MIKKSINSSVSHTSSNKDLVSVCGLYCGACGIYIATQENDNEKILKYAMVLNQSLGETFCDGCRAERKSDHCSRSCLFIKCSLEKGIKFCGTCPEFPCAELKAFQSRMPHRVEILESQNRLMEIGLEKWLIEMKENYTCPKCKVVNSSYDLACRSCWHVPSCRFVERNFSLIKSHLDSD